MISGISEGSLVSAGGFRFAEKSMLVILVLVIPFFAGSTHYIGLALSGLLLWLLASVTILGFSITKRNSLTLSPFEILGIITLLAVAVSAFQATYSPSAWQAVAGLLLLGIAYRVARSSAEDASFRRVVAIALLVSGLVQSLWALHQYFFSNWYAEFFTEYFNEFMTFNMRAGRLRVIGGFINPNLLAAFLNLCLAVVISLLLLRPMKWRWRLILLALGVLYVGVIVLTASKAGMAAAFVVTAIIFGLRDRRLLLVLLVVLVLVLVVPNPVGDQYVRAVESDPYFVMRVHIWDASLRMAIDHPILGVGPNNYHYVDHRYEPPTDMSLVKYSHNVGIAHNSYLHALDEFGLLGFLPLLLIVLLTVAAIWIIFKEKWSGSASDPYLIGFAAGITAILLHSLVDNAAHNRCILGVCLFLFAPIAARLAEKRALPFTPFNRKTKIPLAISPRPFPWVAVGIVLLGFAVAHVAMPLVYEWQIRSIVPRMNKTIGKLQSISSEKEWTGITARREKLVSQLNEQIIDLEVLASFYPGNEAVRRNLGTAHSEVFRATGDFRSFNEAIANFRAAEAALPGLGINAHLQLGLYFDFFNLDYASADGTGELLDLMETLAQRIMRECPTKALYYLTAAKVSHARGELEEAVRRLEFAISLEPNYLKAIADLYVIAKEIEDADLETKALEMYREAVARIKAGPKPASGYAGQILEPSPIMRID